MKIVVNTAHQRLGGAIQVALSFIYECRRFSDHDFFVWAGPGVTKSLDEKEFPKNFRFSYFNFGIIGLKTTLKINRILKQEEKKINPDVIIATSGPSYFHSKAPQIIGFNLPLYLYPESPHVQNWSLSTRLKMLIKKKLHFYFFRRDAAAYVVQTDDVNNRVKKVLNTEKVYTVSNTHNHYFHNWKKYPSKVPARQAGTFRFLTISSRYPHKNLDLIPEVQHTLKNQGIHNVEFVLTLKPEDFDHYIKKGNGLSGIYNVGPIPPEECPSLYNECDALFLPTLAECFSASYPEAMVMRKPIITTDLGFAHSICGSAALYFKPTDAASAAQKIEELITSKSLQKELIQAGYKELKKFDTAAERAEKYLAICERFAKNEK